MLRPTTLTYLTQVRTVKISSYNFRNLWTNKLIAGLFPCRRGRRHRREGAGACGSDLGRAVRARAQAQPPAVDGRDRAPRRRLPPNGGRRRVRFSTFELSPTVLRARGHRDSGLINQK